MQQSARIRRGCVWVLVGAAVLIALVPWRGIIWDGGFPNVECRLTFVNADNKAVPGVTLTVLTKAGGRCHFYPVDEFVPDQPVVSDSEGRLVFHHSSNFLEFAGHEYTNLFGMRFGDTDAPHYDCVFTHDGREVFRTPFNFHHREWETYHRSTVQRRQAPLWDSSKHNSPEEAFETWRLRQFDGKTDELDREERIAAHNFRQQFFRETRTQEITYLVVERTIVIPNP